MRFFVIVVIALVWLFSLVNESGWGLSLQTGSKMNGLILLWAAYWCLVRNKRYVPRVGRGLSWSIFLVFVVVAYLVSHKWDGASYLVSFLAIYCFSNICLTEKELSLSSLIVGLMGAGLITVYRSTAILSGWNDNAIAMLTLFSFIYFSIHFNSVKAAWHKYLCWGIALWYALQLMATESRGAVLFMFAIVFLILYRQRARQLLSTRRFNALAIHLPLLIAIGTVVIAGTSYFQGLNAWSLSQFGKTIFNGRDELWLDGFNDILLYPLGRGDFTINYHNSAVACISVFGVVGYWLWSAFFKKCVDRLSLYVNDDMVYGCLCAFLVIYVQQSTELGFITPMPNMLPYMILGLGLGRVRRYEYIKRK